MRTEVAPGVSLAGRLVGDGPLTVVLVHGWMMSGSVFEALVPRLQSDDIRLAVVDLRGAGSSSKPESGYGLDQYASDLAAWIEALDADRVDLLGHSMGGAVAQLCAAAIPERIGRLFLMNPVPLSGVPLPEPVHELFSTCAGDRSKQGRILDMSTLQLAAEDRDRLLDVAATVSGPCIRESLVAWTSGGFTERLSEIEAETHVIGTSDPFLPPEFLTSAIVEQVANARFHLLTGPGHYPLVEAPDATAELLRSLL